MALFELARVAGGDETSSTVVFFFGVLVSNGAGLVVSEDPLRVRRFLGGVA